jgi:CDP-paratose 2-epimerase
MSCIYGLRQLGTEDQGWVAHFILSALEDSPITIFGDGHQVRDVLAVEDAVEIYARALAHPQAVSGRAFNVGGGPQNAVSLEQVLSFLARLLEKPIEIRYAQWRPDDQRYYVSDTRAIRSTLSLPTVTLWKSGIAKLTDWFSKNASGARYEDVVGGAL